MYTSKIVTTKKPHKCFACYRDFNVGDKMEKPLNKEFLLNEDLFGRYCTVEQKRYGAPNEYYTYKIIGQLRSNSFVTVPVDSGKTGDENITHNLEELEDVVWAICAGVDETRVRKYRIKDIKFIPISQEKPEIKLPTIKEMLDNMEKFSPQYRSAVIEAISETINWIKEHNQ